MAYDFFQNAIDSGATLLPDESYRELQQAFVNDQWDNTVARRSIEEQDRINNTWDSFTFHCIEVWIDYIVGESSRGMKTSEDFASLIFRNLNYEMFKGRYYKFDNNFWISYFENKYNGVTKAMAVRRCNNFMRIVDPENGSIYTIPCVIDYDMSSPTNQIGKDIITPNNHAVVMVQGNSYTNRLFQLNTRYIFNGRPFKLNGYQNTLNNTYFNEESTLLYLDLYLDEIHANDDLVNQIADNGTYIYTVEIDNENIGINELAVGSNGKFYASTSLNGIEIEHEVEWTSSDPKIISINNNGEYEVFGEVGESATITVNIKGNPMGADSMEVIIVESVINVPSIIIEPSFEVIRECESIRFKVVSIYNGIEQEVDESQVSLNETEEILSNKNLLIEKNGNEYKLNCIRRSNEPQTLYVKVSNADPAFTGEKQFIINLVSLMG